MRYTKLLSLNIFSALANILLRAKSKLINGTRLAMQCGVRNYNTVSEKSVTQVKNVFVEKKKKCTIWSEVENSQSVSE